jgi:hypothetical protein
VAPAPQGPSAGRPGRRVDWWRVAPFAGALVLCVVYLIWVPRTVDLAAHEYRAWLFGQEGFGIWNGQWYGGHHTPAYSVLSPPLAWLLGPPLTLVLAVLASTSLFGPLARAHFGVERARWGAIWFGIGSTMLLFTNRLPFAVGVALGLGALLALQRRRRKLAILLAILCPMGSPVAGLFLSLAGVAHAIGSRRDRGMGIAVAAASFVAAMSLSLMFPEGGYAPFPTSVFFTIMAFVVLALVVLPRAERTLRWGLILYGLGSILALAVETPMGLNAARLGTLFGGPVLFCALWGRWPRRRALQGVLLAGFCTLAVWQWGSPVGDVKNALTDPAADASYFEPLKQYLKTLPDQRRIEIPFTRTHWESAEIAPIAPLARGWLRQLDTGRNPIFYKGPLNRLTYASWLAENAVRYVALPSAKPDPSSYGERALIEGGLPYLKLRWRSEDWRVYEVILPAPFVIPRGNANMTLEQLGIDRVLLRVIRPGEALVRVRWTPYWLAHGGCVESSGGWTRVTAFKQGFLELTTRFAPERVFEHGRRCDGG